MNGGETPVQYVEARRALLDALTALQPHIDAFVLIGAQAVYVRTSGRLPGYQPFTTDADLALDPSADSRLSHYLPTPCSTPDSSTAASPAFGTGTWCGPASQATSRFRSTSSFLRTSLRRPAAAVLDFLAITAARKSVGVEGALVDNGPVAIASLDATDARSVLVNVAGPAALLVAKAHKLGERLATPHRLLAKDAGDVFRLFEATSLDEMNHLMQMLLNDRRCAEVTTTAVEYMRQLFATPRAPGIRLAVQALDIAADQVTVTTTMTGYTQDLIRSLRS